MIRAIDPRLSGTLLVLAAGVLAGLSGGLVARPAISEARDSGRTAFQITLDFVSSASPSFTVPPGKRLALMYVAVTMNVATGQQPLVSVKTTVGGNTAEYPLILTRQVNNLNGNDIYFGSQSLSGIFADGGTDVIINGGTTMSRSFNGKIALSACSM